MQKWPKYIATLYSKANLKQLKQTTQIVNENADN